MAARDSAAVAAAISRARCVGVLTTIAPSSVLAAAVFATAAKQQRIETSTTLQQVVVVIACCSGASANAAANACAASDPGLPPSCRIAICCSTTELHPVLTQPSNDGNHLVVFTTENALLAASAITRPSQESTSHSSISSPCVVVILLDCDAKRTSTDLLAAFVFCILKRSPYHITTTHHHYKLHTKEDHMLPFNLATAIFVARSDSSLIRLWQFLSLLPPEVIQTTKNKDLHTSQQFTVAPIIALSSYPASHTVRISHVDSPVEDTVEFVSKLIISKTWLEIESSDFGPRNTTLEWSGNVAIFVPTMEVARQLRRVLVELRPTSSNYLVTLFEYPSQLQRGLLTLNTGKTSKKDSSNVIDISRQQSKCLVLIVKASLEMAFAVSTIPKVSLVIDCGLTSTEIYDPMMDYTKLRVVPSSQEIAVAIAASANRFGNDHVAQCLRLYTEKDYNRLMNKTLISQVSARDFTIYFLFLLYVGSGLWCKSVVDIALPTVPSQEQLEITVGKLNIIGCIDENGDITDFGRQVISTQVATSMCLNFEQCLMVNEALKHRNLPLLEDVVAGISVSQIQREYSTSIFNLDEFNESRKRKRGTTRKLPSFVSKESDFASYRNAARYVLKAGKGSKEDSKENFLNSRIMEKVLVRRGKILADLSTLPQCSVMSSESLRDNEILFSSCIVAGLVTNAAYCGARSGFKYRRVVPSTGAMVNKDSCRFRILESSTVVISRCYEQGIDDAKEMLHLPGMIVYEYLDEVRLTLQSSCDGDDEGTSGDDKQLYAVNVHTVRKEDVSERLSLFM